MEEIKREENIFGKLNRYYEICLCLSEKQSNRVDLLNEIKAKGVGDTTARGRVKEVFENKVSFITIVDDKAVLDLVKLKQEINEAILLMEGKNIGKTKKPKPEDGIASVKDAHSPGFNKMKQDYDDAMTSLKALKKENVVLKKGIDMQLARIILASMDAKVLVPATVDTDPAKVIEDDFFYDNPGSRIDLTPYVRKSGGVLENIYKVKKDSETVFSEENYFIRLLRQFSDGRLFKKRLADEEGVIRDRGLKYDLDENRRRSVELLLADHSMDNQTKLSTYAWWYWSDDPQMAELLDYAADHAINADSVIRLMEMPEEFQNYSNMRMHLRQLTNASEAHIKRETIQELLCGDWQVVADYCGKQCHFRLYPVEELQAYYNLLVSGKFDEANEKLGMLLSTTCVQVEHKLEREELNEFKDIEAPAFIHEIPADVEMPNDADVDIAMDDFAESTGEKKEEEDAYFG